MANDADLELRALDALQHYPGVRVWTDALDIKARDGVIEVSGHVRTRVEQQVTENVLLTVPGVRDVVSHLYVDTDLEIAVAQALGKDSRTRESFPGILVGAAFGEIYLKGSVASPEIKKAAGEIAAQVPGVRNVLNQLEAPEPIKPTPTAKAAAAKPAPKPTPAVEEEENSP